MAETINIKLVRGDNIESGFREEPSVPDLLPQEPQSPDAVVKAGANGDMLKKYVSLAAVATTAYKLAKLAYERSRAIALDDRQRLETLRNYGGSGFAANTFGDTFDIFGNRIRGESVAYKR
jgi:hypothetical protein